MIPGRVRAIAPPSDGKKVAITIAQFVVWAYRDQMVHAARPEGMPVEIARDWSPRIAQTEFAKEMVSSSVKLDFQAAPDAYRVHDAVMRLPTVERKRTQEEIECLLARKLCSNELLRLDTEAGKGRLDMQGTPDARGDGTRVDEVESIHLPSLVFQWAMKGRPPDWVPEPVYVLEKGRAFYNGRRRESIGHQVKPVGDDPLEVEHQRSLYVLWARGMALLRADIAGRHRLSNHVLSSDVPSDAPWQSQGALDLGKKLA